MPLELLETKMLPKLALGICRVLAKLAGSVDGHAIPGTLDPLPRI